MSQLKLVQSESALNNVFKTFEINGLENIDLNAYLDLTALLIEKQLKEEIKKEKSLKIDVAVLVNLTKISNDKIVSVKPCFRSGPQNINSSTNIPETFETIKQKIIESFESYTSGGSGWIFQNIDCLLLKVNKNVPLSGSSYIDLPKEIKAKKAVINVQNKDNRCFEYAILSEQYNKEIKSDHQKPSKHKEYLGQLNFTGIEFPVSLKDIDKFENQNPEIRINVFGYDKSVHILRINKKDPQNAIDLLLITDGEEKEHYCWIKNFSRLLSAQVSKHKSAVYFCKRCLNHFSKPEKLNDHIEICKEKSACKIEVPKPGEIIEFKNHKKSLRVPFVIYADFEAVTEKIDSASPDPEKSFTEKYQKHTPSGFCYYVKKDGAENYAEPVVYRGEDCVEKFCTMIEEEVKEIGAIYKDIIPLEMTAEDNEKFYSATDCHICNKKLYNDKTIPFNKEPIHQSCLPAKYKGTSEFKLSNVMEKGDWRNYFKKSKCAICAGPLSGETVKDHDHLTGKFRGAAHNYCNLQYQMPKFVPVIFHNLSGYDSHLFIKQLGKSHGNISCIPNNDEKYISFGKSITVDDKKFEIRFIDSFKFMASSLDALCKNLSREQFREMNKVFKSDTDLLIRKGVYPYDYMDNFDKFNETKLPPANEFYSRLYDSNVNEKDYAHAQKVWSHFGFKNMGEYHDLYLKTDVVLLADIFENFRDVCLKNYKLDPAWYYTSPGLSWDALLKKTEIKLDLLSDINMILFIETRIRGGVSMISNRYSKANNKYMENYNPAEESKFITYLDANNLYGWGMSQKLPFKNFRWLDEAKLANFNPILINAEDNTGYILQVDLEYPKELHDAHNDYPLAPGPMKLNKIDKLTPNLKDKAKYILHLKNLQLYLSLGLKLTKIHKVLAFDQKDWMRPYITLNTDLRTASKNDFEKDFFKLMNNSVFGKTMENIRNRVDIRLVNEEKQAKKLVSKPKFERRKIFCADLAAVHMKRTKIKFDKPIYVGFCILDLSKTLMYDFHYNYIVKKYGPKQKLLFTDTDSLAYEIKTEDFYQDINEDVPEKFDTSNFAKNHPSGIKTGYNKKVIGMMKDECGGKQITEFVGLRAKMYSYKVDKIEEKKAKGVKKNVIKKDISFNDYYKCLTREKNPIYRKMNLIRSHNHEIYSETINKIALSADDDKRNVDKDGISTLAYGHYKLKLKKLTE